MDEPCIGGSCPECGDPNWNHAEYCSRHEKHEPPDLRGPALIVTGSVLGGFKFYGPFATIEAAVTRWKTTLAGTLGLSCTVTLIENIDDLGSANSTAVATDRET